MELKVSVAEAIALIKEVENVPAKILEYIGMNIQKEVGMFLTNLMGEERKRLRHSGARRRAGSPAVQPRMDLQISSRRPRARHERSKRIQRMCPARGVALPARLGGHAARVHREGLRGAIAGQYSHAGSVISGHFPPVPHLQHEHPRPVSCRRVPEGFL